MYGIPSDEVFASVDTGDKKTESERFDSYMNDQYRRKISALAELMERESDSVIYGRMEAQISGLYSLVSAKDDTVKMSLTEFLRGIETRRNNNR